MSSLKIRRRMVLKGLGAALALPMLEAMFPAAARAAAGGTPKFPLRMGFVYVPNGIHLPDWTPGEEGPIRKVELPPTLKLMEQYHSDMLIISGLAQAKAAANGDGPGDHARAMATYLTGVQAKKTSGANIHVGVSVDQVAAEKIGLATRFPSLEIGCDGGRQSGECDSGYSCAYINNLSWKTGSTPVAKETNPRAVFDRLFGGQTDAATLQQEKYRRSILDGVREDARELRVVLGVNDQRKLDDYLTAVRELEIRLNRTEKKTDEELAAAKIEVPDKIPADYQAHVRLMADMLVLAFQTDMTRVSTFAFANEQSNRSYRFIDVPEGHHDLSHEGKPEKLAKVAKINRFHMEQFAYFIGKLKEIKEGDGTLLDHCMITYGSGIADGNKHNHDELPLLLVGQGNGTIKTGRHVRFPKDTPLNNLWLAMLDRMGATTEQLGDSSGRLQGLDS